MKAVEEFINLPNMADVYVLTAIGSPAVTSGYMTLPLKLLSVQSSILSSVQLGSATRLQTLSRMTTSEVRRDTEEQEQAQAQAQHSEDRVVRRDGALRSILRGLFWPFGVMVRAYRGVWWVLGFRQPQEVAVVTSEAPSPARQSLAGRKRLRRVTRLLLSILPRMVQGALGYPVSSSIGRSLSPEIRVSPTKPCGKGSKRKQDELDEDEEEEHPTWVEALNQELADDEDAEEDPDYEPTTVDTESEEYCSHNNTESDIEVTGHGVVIEDVNVDIYPSSPVACPAV